MLSSVRIRNFKAIADTRINLTPLHLLIGPNDSGKTSMLEVIAALSRSLDHRLQSTFLGRWSDRQLVHAFAKERTITIAGKVDGALSGTYELQCEFPGPAKQVVLRKAIWNNGQELSIGYGKENTLTGYQNAHQLAEHPGYEEASELANSICPCWFLRWSARNLSLPATLKPDRTLRLEGNGFGLPTLLDDLLGHDRSSFTRVEELLSKQFPEVKGLRLKQESAFDSPVDVPEQTLALTVGSGKQLYFILEGGAEIPAPQMAEGILYVTAYLAILQLPDPPKILLIEEPENGIHPARVREVVKLLRGITEERPETQIIMASHSPYLVDEMNPNEVTWCRKENGRIITERLDENKTVQRQKGLFELGEIWSNYLDPVSGITDD